MTSAVLTTRLTDSDVRLFRQGQHMRLYEKMGAQRGTLDGTPGTFFAVWAPAARQVAVIGDFNGWDKQRHVLHRRTPLGIWEGFVPSALPGMKYKYCITGSGNDWARDKADPFAWQHEAPPHDASVICDLDYPWQDQAWMERRCSRSALDEPLSIYEVHLGSWLPERDVVGQSRYRITAQRLAPYVKQLGFTHVELLPVMEYGRDESAGYDTTGYFAPTSRYGTPQDFMFLVDYLHQHDIGVLVDWMPAHFSDAAHALQRFDGAPLFEATHQQASSDHHRLRFDFARGEVASFLASSALFWIERYHVDGLRMVGVTSMIYPDGPPQPGATDERTGSEDLAAVALLQRLNERIAEEHADVMTIADDATWPMVCWPVKAAGGLGFGFQWDSQWARDAVAYMRLATGDRKEHHRRMTRHTLEAFNENIVLPVSHEEMAAHRGKTSLLEQMPSDEWQKLANLRLLLGYLFAQPGKKLLFMGTEFGERKAWRPDRALDWDLLQLPQHRGLQAWVHDLNQVYHDEPALYEFDRDAEGFEWVDSHDEVRSVLSFLRKGWRSNCYALALCNFTPQPRTNYRVGIPCGGFWKEILNSDAEYYGGSGWGNMGGVSATPVPFHDRPYSINATLPPLAIVVFKHEG